MGGASKQKFKFGDIEVDPEANLIWVAGKQKRLEPKLIALLVYLVESAQQVISRQQITEAIWPDVVVGEESITQAIFALRNALGDDAKKPQYIETIPKKGYRFLAEASLVQAATAPKAARPGWQLAVAVLVAGLLAGAALLGYRQLASTGYEVAAILPVTKMPGAECCMALNPHNQLAFINQSHQGSDIYVKDLNSGTQERITQDKLRKLQVLWRDDSTLIYSRCQGFTSGCELVQQQLAQSPRVIYRSPDEIGSISLMPGATRLLFSVFTDKRTQLLILDLLTGQLTDLREQYPQLPTYLLQPHYLATSQQLIFIAIDPSARLMALDMASHNIQLISDQFELITGYTLNRQQQFIIAGSYKASNGLWLLTPSRAQPQLILRAPGNEQFASPLLDSSEQHLYYQNTQFNRDIGIASHEADTSEELPELNSMATDAGAILSQDGQLVYFISDRTGFHELWNYDLHKQHASPVTHLKGPGELRHLLLSNDGKRLCAKYLYNSETFLRVFSTLTGELLASAHAHAVPLSWSADDRYIYATDYSNNLPALVRYDSQTLAATELQQNAGLLAQETQDGAGLRFMDMAKNALVERRSSGEDKELITMDVDLHSLMASRLRLNASQSALLLIKQDQNRPELWQYPLNSQQASPQKILALPQDAWVSFINQTGSQVLYETLREPNGDIMKIELQ